MIAYSRKKERIATVSVKVYDRTYEVGHDLSYEFRTTLVNVFDHAFADKRIQKVLREVLIEIYGDPTKAKKK